MLWFSFINLRWSMLRFTLSLLLGFNAVTLAICVDDPNWVKLKINHVPLTLGTGSLQKLCSLTSLSRIEKHLDNICIPRTVGTANHSLVANYIDSKLREFGYTVESHEFQDQTPFGRRTFKNIIGTKHPNAKRHLVLACHYDSKMFSNFAFYAATDSAFPCALLLDVAETLNTFMTSAIDDLTLQLLFLDGEEAFREWTATDSLYGSRKLAGDWAVTPYPAGNRHGTVKLDQIDLFVLLDLLGAANPSMTNFPQNVESMYQVFPSTETALRGLQCCLKSTATIFSTGTTWAWGREGIQDDHLPFMKKGVRVVHLIPAPFPLVWHTEQDTRAALDGPTMQNWASILRAFVAQYLHLTIPIANVPWEQCSGFS